MAFQNALCRFAVSCFLGIAVLGSAQDGKIVIRLLNGRTGKAIRDKRFNVWLGTGNMLLLNADGNGEIDLDVSDVNLVKFGFIQTTVSIAASSGISREAI